MVKNGDGSFFLSGFLLPQEQAWIPASAGMTGKEK